MTLRLHAPPDPCVCCGGAGTLAKWDPDCGFEYRACSGACNGVASAGLFLVRLHFGLMREELSWQSSEFAKAVACAEYYAARVRPIMMRRGCVSEVVVVFRPFGSAECDEETVHAAGVWSREPIRAA